MHKVQPTSSWWESELPGGPGEEAIMVFQDAFEHSRKFMDHAGWSKEYGKTVLVSEPYALNTEDLLELLKFIAPTVQAVFKKTRSSPRLC